MRAKAKWGSFKTGLALLAAIGLISQPEVAIGQERKKEDLGSALAGALAALLKGGKQQVRTTLDQDSLRVLGSFKIKRKAFFPFQAYQAWPACTYSWVSKKRDGAVKTDVVTMSSKAVRDRFLVTVKHSRGISTALLGSDGTAYDYNWIDLDDGSRISRETLNSIATRKIARETARSKVKAKDIVMLEPMTIGFPVFFENSRHTGETAAYAKMTNGANYAEFVYGGTLTYKGHKGVLLQVVVNRNGELAGGPVLIGYYVLRQDNMMPLLQVWQTDDLDITDVIHCT